MQLKLTTVNLCLLDCILELTAWLHPPRYFFWSVAESGDEFFGEEGFFRVFKKKFNDPFGVFVSFHVILGEEFFGAGDKTLMFFLHVFVEFQNE